MAGGRIVVIGAAEGAAIRIGGAAGGGGGGELGAAAQAADPLNGGPAAAAAAAPTAALELYQADANLFLNLVAAKNAKIAHKKMFTKECKAARRRTARLKRKVAAQLSDKDLLDIMESRRYKKGAGMSTDAAAIVDGVMAVVPEGDVVGGAFL
jgi:hypothetical protein